MNEPFRPNRVTERTRSVTVAMKRHIVAHFDSDNTKSDIRALPSFFFSLDVFIARCVRSNFVNKILNHHKIYGLNIEILNKFRCNIVSRFDLRKKFSHIVAQIAEKGTYLKFRYIKVFRQQIVVNSETDSGCGVICNTVCPPVWLESSAIFKRNPLFDFQFSSRRIKNIQNGQS